MVMPSREVDGNVEVTLDPEKFETFKYQENDYNNEDILLNSIRFKIGQMVKDFDFEGLFTIGFP